MTDPESPAAGAPDFVGAGHVDQSYLDRIPQCRALALRLVGANSGVVEIAMPWHARLVGDPSTGVIAGGAVSTLMDTCSGLAVVSHFDGRVITATLDLRIDYMRPATRGQTITARAEVYQMTRSVAFVRAIATDDDSARPVATATGAFTVAAG